jgi:hypothetical protein
VISSGVLPLVLVDLKGWKPGSSLPCGERSTVLHSAFLYKSKPEGFAWRIWQL